MIKLDDAKDKIMLYKKNGDRKNDFLACPPVYTLPGTWSDPEKIARCNDTLIPHFTFNPNYTFGISIAVITLLLAAYGVYKGFFANEGLKDPWDDHED